MSPFGFFGQGLRDDALSALNSASCCTKKPKFMSSRSQCRVSAIGTNAKCRLHRAMSALRS